MRLYRKFIRPVHCYPGQSYEPKTELIEKEEKWYPEEEREHLEEKYGYLDEEPCSNLVFEEKYEPYLLKEQEARVMTLDEVKAFDWDYCYLEEERLPGKEYRTFCGNYALTCITWPCVTSMRIQHGDDNYGKKWRCWSAKPTDEQRQEVKWDA